MIQSKKDYIFYLKADEIALKKKKEVQFSIIGIIFWMISGDLRDYSGKENSI